MRTAAILACTLLLSSTALAQSKGGPSLDPLGDKTHNEPDARGPENAAGQRVQKVRVKKRTTRITTTRTAPPGPSKATPPKKKPVPAKKPKVKKP